MNSTLVGLAGALIAVLLVSGCTGEGGFRQAAFFMAKITDISFPSQIQENTTFEILITIKNRYDEIHPNPTDNTSCAIQGPRGCIEDVVCVANLGNKTEILILPNSTEKTMKFDLNPETIGTHFTIIIKCGPSYDKENYSLMSHPQMTQSVFEKLENSGIIKSFAEGEINFDYGNL